MGIPQRVQKLTFDAPMVLTILFILSLQPLTSHLLMLYLQSTQRSLQDLLLFTSMLCLRRVHGEHTDCVSGMNECWCLSVCV